LLSIFYFKFENFFKNKELTDKLLKDVSIASKKIKSNSEWIKKSGLLVDQWLSNYAPEIISIF
jgi:hypothetical protein